MLLARAHATNHKKHKGTSKAGVGLSRRRSKPLDFARRRLRSSESERAAQPTKRLEPIDRSISALAPGNQPPPQGGSCYYCVRLHRMIRSVGGRLLIRLGKRRRERNSPCRNKQQHADWIGYYALRHTRHPILHTRLSSSLLAY